MQELYEEGLWRKEEQESFFLKEQEMLTCAAFAN
jgi:hypothetical protein